MRGRCRGRYGDFAAGSGLLRQDCKGCRDRLAAKRGWIRRCERAIWAWRDGIGGGSAGESEVVMRAWSLPAESRQEERVSGRAAIADDGIMIVSILIAAGGGAGRCLGSHPRAKVSMTIMRPPQHGHGCCSTPDCSGAAFGGSVSFW